ncbi:MAG TPA: hypothetical protein VM260_13930, partial [Pirellula sp.]|nr:hypothetical protein [Pirellula sp.]
MLSKVTWGFYKCRLIFAALGIMSVMSSSTFANPWARALGDAKHVQNRTKDIAERLNREFPYNQVTMVALQMDNSACQVLEAVKCGASWGQIQASLSRTCAYAGQVNELVNADCHVRNDRRTRDYINDLSKRIERLHCSLDKAFELTQPKFCAPPVPSNRPSWNFQFQSDPFASSPNSSWTDPPQNQHRNIPADPRYNGYPSHPRDTYEFESQPLDGRAFPFESVPKALPLGRPIGPIEYRVDRSIPSQNGRTAAFVQLGL